MTRTTIFSLAERMPLVEVIRMISPYTHFDPEQTVREYYDGIVNAEEFIALHEFSDIFPEAYQMIIGKNIIRIRDEIKEMIIDDVDFFAAEDTFEGATKIDELLHVIVERLKGIYNFRLSQKQLEEINDVGGYDYYPTKKTGKKSTTSVDTENQSLPENEDNTKDNQKYLGYQLAMERLLPQWDTYLNRDSALKYIRFKINNTAIEKEILNRITNNPIYEDFITDTQSIDLLLSYLNKYKEDTKDRYVCYQRILDTLGLNSQELTLLQRIAHDLYNNGETQFRKDIFESHDQDEYQIDINKFNAILIQKGIWYKFPDRDFHTFLAVKHISTLSPEERIKIYQEFEEEDFEGDEYQTLWKFYFSSDRVLFSSEFIIPSIQEEFQMILADDKDQMTINFLKRHSIKTEFCYSESQDSFQFNSGSLNHSMIISIINVFREWKIEDPTNIIDECFNLSLVSSPLVKNYIQKHFLKDNKYTIDFPAEVTKKAFQKLLTPSGATKIVVEYISALKKLHTELSTK